MRYSLRDCFLAFVIVAIGICWWLDRQRLIYAKEESEARAQIAENKHKLSQEIRAYYRKLLDTHVPGWEGSR